MRTKRIIAKALLVAMGGLTTLGALPSEASACGGAWYGSMGMEVEQPQIDYRIYGVPRAEKALEDGRTLASAGYIIRMIPHVKQLKPSSTKIVERAQRVLALAIVRYDGALPITHEVPEHVHGTWMGKTAEHRAENLEWAADMLRDVSDLRKSDPVSQTELAEGLAKVDAYKAEARDILEKLAKKDLITSPEGYAALASLRASVGDAKGEKVAMQRCQKMAKSAEVCRAPSAQAS